MSVQDVPSPIDLKNPQDALQWANDANEKRPWRYDFFDYYVNLIQKAAREKQHQTDQNVQFNILEIGSGPGFLAKHLLSHCLEIKYTALDFSDAMNELSKSKLLSSELDRAQYLIADFKK